MGPRGRAILSSSGDGAALSRVPCRPTTARRRGGSTFVPLQRRVFVWIGLGLRRRRTITPGVADSSVTSGARTMKQRECGGVAFRMRLINDSECGASGDVGSSSTEARRVSAAIAERADPLCWPPGGCESRSAREPDASLVTVGASDDVPLWIRARRGRGFDLLLVVEGGSRRG